MNIYPTAPADLNPEADEPHASAAPTRRTGLPVGATIVEFLGASKWYGNVIGLNKLTLRIPVGVTGLLGPNGAGKSTLLQLATGQLRPSQGTVRVLGHTAWNNPALNRHLGLCPEQDAFYEWLTGRQFIRNCALLAGLGGAGADQATEQVLDVVGMTRHADRAVKGYSKGMRQRTKLAQSLVHDPEVLFLDEPLTGTDPVARRDLIDVINQIGAQGKSVIFSSHVLHEVQAVTPHIVLLNRGRLVAEGHVRQIRDLIDKHPHRIVLKSAHDRALAARLVAFEDVVGVELTRSGGGILVETIDPGAFYGRLADLVLDDGMPIDEVYSDDDNLESVFRYLVNP